MDTPPGERFRIDPADTTVTLTAEQLARLRRGFDVRALERLLGMVNPREREWVLGFFLYPSTGELVIENLVYFDDPALQAVLEEVWAPYWDLLPAEALYLDRTDTPGRAIARARREARSREMGGGSG